MSRRKKDRGCGMIALILLLFVLAGGVIGFVYVKRYMPSNELADKEKIFRIQDGRVALLLDNELQDARGIYEDGQVYLPVKWVNEHLNQRFYWDENERLLVYTLPDTIVYADENTMGERGTLIKVTSEGMYLSLGLVLNYTDIRTEAFVTSQIKRVFVDTSWEPYETAVVKKEGRLREKGGIKSPVITDVYAGDQVDLLESMDKWTRVRTKDGYVGYLENRRLEGAGTVTPVSQFEAPVYTNLSMDEKVRLGFHMVTTEAANANLTSLVENTRDMNVIVPTWFNVKSNDGTYTSLASKEYVDKAHDMGLKVWAMVENVSTAESIKNLDTEALMSSTSTRKKLIENLMKEADTYGFDGFNLDFESFKAEAGPHYVQFIRELSVSCRKKGLVLSVDNPVPSSYSTHFNRKEQGIVADYVIIMGYDEHYSGGEAGPVSSISFVKKAIENTLKEVPKEKVINAVPFYTRVWTVSGDTTTSRAYGMKEAKQWVETNNVELTWDDELGLYRGGLDGSDGKQYIWMEEEESMSLKIKAVRDADLAGVACWRLGFEPTDIWDIISTVK